MKILAIMIIFASIAYMPSALASGGGPAKESELLGVEKIATPITTKVNKDLLKILPFSDREDFKNAQRGFIARGDEAPVRREEYAALLRDLEAEILQSLDEFRYSRTPVKQNHKGI